MRHQVWRGSRVLNIHLSVLYKNFSVSNQYNLVLAKAERHTNTPLEELAVSWWPKGSQIRATYALDKNLLHMMLTTT